MTADLSSWIAKAREVIARATPGRVEADRFGVIRGGPLNEYVNGSGRSGLVMVSSMILSDDDTSEEVILRRDADTARVAIALNSLPALLDVAEAAAAYQEEMAALGNGVDPALSAALSALAPGPDDEGKEKSNG